MVSSRRRPPYPDCTPFVPTQPGALSRIKNRTTRGRTERTIATAVCRLARDPEPDPRDAQASRGALRHGGEVRRRLQAWAIPDRTQNGERSGRLHLRWPPV